jgi:hypothetical protein
MGLLDQTEVNHRAQVATEAWRRAAIVIQQTDDLVASSRALLAKSRELLAELEHTDALRMPRRVSLPESVVISRSEGTLSGTAVHQSDRTPVQHGELSTRVFKDGEQFGWRVYSPTKEMLGSGTAESEFSARVDALHAGMTYIDRLKGRSAPTNSRLH